MKTELYFVSLDEIAKWMTDTDVRMDLHVTWLELDAICKEGKLLNVMLPLGRLHCRHSVASLKVQMAHEKVAQ